MRREKNNVLPFPRCIVKRASVQKVEGFCTMVISIAPSTSEDNLPDFTPFEIEQTSYDASCVQYEEATDRKLKVKGDTIILGGYGACIKVEHKALVLSYGRMSEEDRTLRLFKGTNKVRQVI